MQGTEVLTPTITLTKLLEDIGIQHIDFLSMDIEQSEPLALAGFDIARFQPKLVCIERSKDTASEVLLYFKRHEYKMLMEYDQWDRSNWYFAPDE